MSEADTCEGCGSPMAFCGPPINEDYCPNKECTYELEQMKIGIRAAMERQERAEYERLKAKYGQ